MRILSFTGGLYAVLRLPAPFQDDPYLSIPNGWQQLTAWLEASDYQMGTHQWLEEQIQYEATPPASGVWTCTCRLLNKNSTISEPLFLKNWCQHPPAGCR